MSMNRLLPMAVASFRRRHRIPQIEINSTILVKIARVDT